MKKYVFKRVFSVFLALVMCLSVMQVTAFAKTVEAQLTCSIPENHTHTSECYEKVLNCGQVEAEAHHHSDACQKKETLTCILTSADLDENGKPHEHSDSCYTVEDVICEIPETDGHQHTDECYIQGELTCQIPEGHVHTAGCYENVTYRYLQEAISSDTGTEDGTILILNGTTLTVENGKSIEIGNGQKLTIQDKENGSVLGGTIVGSNGKYVITVLDGGSLTLSGNTTITHNADNKTQYNETTGVVSSDADETKQGAALR